MSKVGMPKVGRRSRFRAAPRADGTIHAEALGLRFVTALQCTTSLVRVAGKTVVAERIVAAYEPDRATRQGALPEGSRYLGDLLWHFYFRTRGGRPCELYIHLPAYERPAAPGAGPEFAVLIPEGFDPKTRLHADLVAELERDLSHHAVLDCRRRTLAPRSAVEAIAARQPERQWHALAADDDEIHYLAIDEVNLKEEGGQDRPALHVVGHNFHLGISFSLALIEVRETHKKKVVGRLARLLLKLPRPEALIALVTDYGKEERKLVAAALRLAVARCPALAPHFVLDRFHIQKAFADAANDFRVETWKRLAGGKRGRNLKKLPKKTQLKIEHIKQAHRALTTTRWSTLEQGPEAMATLERAFAAAAELETAFWLLEQLRRIFDARSLQTAEALYTAWKQTLKASGLTCFNAPARHLAREWKQVRVYFAVLEILDARFKKGLKIGSHAVEGNNRESKAVWRYARRSSMARIEQRLLARKGYIIEAQGARPPSNPRRPRKKGS